MNAASSVPTRSPRLHSLDALRGLDMLIILGLDALILLLASRNPENGFLQEAARQMTHARWEGLHLSDLVFPVFVFISGASMSFSLAKYTGTSIAPGLFHLWKRAFGLAFLGLLVNGTLTWTESMRYASVLGLIGFSCAIAGTCILLCRLTGAVASAAGFILVLITLLQFTCGNFTPDGSVNSWVDRHWLPGRLHGGVFDPEGPLCVVSASALCMGGWIAGKFLKESRLPPVRLCTAMAGPGLVLFCTARMLDGAAAPSQDIDAAMAENWKFHRYIYEMSGSEVLARQIESFWEQTERYRRIYIGQPGTRDGTDREHRELVSLIASHDAQRAADFQIRNNRRTQRAVLESMNETLPTEKIRLVSAAEYDAFLRWKSGRGQAE